MKLYLVLGTLAFAFLPKGLFAQKPTLSCRPLSGSNTFIAADEQIVGDQVCKIVVPVVATKAAQPAPVATLASGGDGCPVVAKAAEHTPRGEGNHSLVWIDPQNSYASYLEAAALKKHTPVEFTTDRCKADYVATVTGNSKKGSATHEVMTGLLFGVPTSGANNSLALSVSDAATGTVVFSYTCKKTGKENFQSSSECLTKHWTHFIENGNR